MKPFWLFLILAPTQYACSGAPPPRLEAANDAATLLCESAPAAVKAAELRGVSVSELCALHDVLQPFIGEALKAQEKACYAAGMSEP